MPQLLTARADRAETQTKSKVDHPRHALQTAVVNTLTMEGTNDPNE